MIYSADIAPYDGPLDQLGHGTNCAGTIARLAPSAKIISLDVLDNIGNGQVSDLITAIDWAVENKEQYNVCALSMSLGDSERYKQYCDEQAVAVALQEARDVGLLTAVAAGNEAHKNGLSMPACARAAVSVGAVYDSSIGRQRATMVCTDGTTAAAKVTCYSNSASYLTITAPGHFVTAGGWTMEGTSMATPFIAGAVAVLKAAVPDATVDDIIAALVQGGRSVRDPRNGLVKPLLDLAASAQLLKYGAAVTLLESVTLVDGASVVSSRELALRVRPFDRGNASVQLWMCAADADARADNTSADACCTLQPLSAKGTGSVSKYKLASPGDGGKRVHVYLRDGASCSSSLLADMPLPITLDGSGPTNVTVVVEGGAANTMNRTVRLAVAAVDVSGVDRMCIRTSAGTAKGHLGSCKWQPFQTSASVKLRNFQGIHTIQVVCRDMFGYVSAPANTSIVYLVSLSAPNGAYTPNSRYQPPNGTDVPQQHVRTQQLD